jgi:precorrin-6B methylase 2
MVAQQDVVRGSAKQTLEPIRFGQYLVEKSAINDEQLLDALADHWAHGGRIGATIARRGFLSLDEVERLAAEYHDLQVIEVEVAVRGAVG